MVAHYQDISGEQAEAVTQLESSAITYYNATVALGAYESGCSKPCGFTRPSDNEYVNYQYTFEADSVNISDPKVRRLATQLDAGLIGMAAYAGELSKDGQAQMGQSTSEAENAYANLIARCGRLIQGKQ